MSVGLSESTSAAYWAARMGMPPARYAMRLKIEEACRLLVKTRLRVGEIADRLGFGDPLYFSRRFHQDVGSTAAEYRHSRQFPLSLMEGSIKSQRPSASGRRSSGGNYPRISEH